jgi:subtilisin family serine protease
MSRRVENLQMAVVNEGITPVNVRSEHTVYRNDSSNDLFEADVYNEESDIVTTVPSDLAFSKSRMTATNGCNYTVASLDNDVKPHHDDGASGDEWTGNCNTSKRVNGHDQEQRSFASAEAANGEMNGKRRRVQHNYRRLSSSGYLDDYDGRERFSGELNSPPSGSSSSPSPKIRPIGAISPRGGSSVRPVGGSRSHKLRCETEASCRGMYHQEQVAVLSQEAVNVVSVNL